MPEPGAPGAAPITPRASRIAWECPWYRVRQDVIRLPDGRDGQYNVVEVAPCVFIVPVTAEGAIVLIRHYRYTLDRWVWEIPAGGIRPGLAPQEAAAQELAEEIGGRAARWQALGAVFTSNGFTNEQAHLFIAWDVALGENAPEAAEVLTVHPTPSAEVFRRVRANQLQDGPSALALLLAEPFVRAAFADAP